MANDDLAYMTCGFDCGLEGQAAPAGVEITLGSINLETTEGA